MNPTTNELTNTEELPTQDATTQAEQDEWTTAGRIVHTLATFFRRAGFQLNGVLLLPLLQPQFVGGELPNPFCNAFNLGLAWVGGIVGCAVLIYGAQIVLRHLAGHGGMDLTKGAMSIIGGLFILGLLMNNGAGLTLLAQAAGFEGFTLGCAAAGF